jgi:hypothetical protein
MTSEKQEEETPERGSHNFGKDKSDTLESKKFITDAIVDDPENSAIRTTPNEPQNRPIDLSVAPLLAGGGVLGLLLGQAISSVDVVQWAVAIAGVLGSALISYIDKKNRSEPQK